MYHLIDYVWCVEKFSQYFEPHDQEVYPLLTSPIFAYKNTRWVLNLYPEGLGDSASHGYISLFIKYVSEDPETINAKVELSLLNNKNERVYCRDTGDHQYQTFIDFGYKQFLKIQDIKEQKDELISYNGLLKIFARVEFEHATLPTSLTWSNYDLLLFKENFKDLYETKNLCDIIIKVVKQPASKTANSNQLALPTSSNLLNNTSNNKTLIQPQQQKYLSSVLYHPYSSNSSGPTNYVSKIKKQQQQPICTCPDCTNQQTGGYSYSTYSSTSSSSSSSSSSSPPQSSQFMSDFDLTSKSTTTPSNAKQETLEIKSHKFILASRSGKFRELLKTNLIKLVSSASVHSFLLLNSSNSSQLNNTYCNKCLKRILIASSTGQLALADSTAQTDESTSFTPSTSTSASCSASSSMTISSSLTNNNINNSVRNESDDQLDSCCTCNDADSKKASVYSSEDENDTECISDMLIIETDRNPKVIEYLIRYMYTGYLDSLDTFAKDIYEISKEYKVHGLTNLAREHIIKELNIQNCCDYLVFCVINNDYELNNKIQAFIAENYETIVKTNAYKQAKRKYRELFENTFNEIFKKIPAFNMR